MVLVNFYEVTNPARGGLITAVIFTDCTIYSVDIDLIMEERKQFGCS